MSSDAVIAYVVVGDVNLRDAIGKILGDAGYRVRSFSSGGEFLAIAEVCLPGCLIYEFGMGDVDGIALLDGLRKSNLPFPVVLVANGDVRLARKALKAGAVDFIQMPLDTAELITAMQDAEAALHAVERAQLSRAAAARLASLSEREREVLERVIAGVANKQIARELRISPRTVEFHRNRVMAKLQAGSLAELIRIALTAGVSVRRDTKGDNTD